MRHLAQASLSFPKGRSSGPELSACAGAGGWGCWRLARGGTTTTTPLSTQRATDSKRARCALTLCCSRTNESMVQGCVAHCRVHIWVKYIEPVSQIPGSVYVSGSVFLGNVYLTDWRLALWALQLDVTWGVVSLLQKLGLATNVKLP